jgi:hypothetical protein
MDRVEGAAAIDGAILRPYEFFDPFLSPEPRSLEE